MVRFGQPEIVHERSLRYRPAVTANNAQLCVRLIVNGPQITGDERLRDGTENEHPENRGRRHGPRGRDTRRGRTTGRRTGVGNANERRERRQRHG